MQHTAQAPQPSRASNSVTLAWGSLILIPLSVYSGTEQTSVSRSEFVQGTDVRVGRANTRKDTGAVIDADTVERRAQSTKGVWVQFTDDEVAAATCPRGTAEIVSFVPVKQVDQYLTSDVSQVRPKRNNGRPDTGAERAFALFCAALRKTKTVALIKVALRGPARYALLTADGDLLFIYTADAIRKPRPVEDHKFNAKELALATTLIESCGIDAPVLIDDTAKAVQAAVDAKAAGKAPTPPTTDHASPSDLMAALSASVADAKARRGKAA